MTVTALPRVAALACLSLLGYGCGGEGAGAGAPSSVTFPDGVRVTVGDDGRVELALDGRSLVTLLPGVELVRYEESVRAVLGKWDFQRSDVERAPLGGVVGRVHTATELRISLGGAGGLAGAVTVSPLRAGATLIRVEASGFPAARALALRLACDAESSYYGFGEQYRGSDRRGEAFPLFVSEQGINRPTTATETYYPMPWWVDARGFGVLARTAHRTLVDLCASDPASARLEVESAEPLELVVMHGPTPAATLAQLADEVGRPKRPPSFAWDLWVAAQGGTAAVLAEADALDAAGIPFGALWVQDWTGPRTNAGGGSGVQYRWREDPIHYPDLAEAITSLRARGIRFLGYANPFVMTSLEHFAPMEGAGLLVKDPAGGTYRHPSPAGDSASPDFTRPETLAFVKAELARMLDLGMAGWMADFGEWLPIDAVASSGLDGRAHHNLFPALWHRASRELLEERLGDDFVLFTRSGWTGQQAVAQIVWAGDQECTFAEGDGLPSVVPAMLDLGLSGLPYVTHDIAGFSGGPSSKELWMRWTELGAFSPVMRTHEGNLKDQNWSWEKDAETTAHFRRFVLVHRALRADLERAAEQAERDALPMVRHLMLAHPDDPESRRVTDQYLLGDDLLVAPVVAAGAVRREVYLPPGVWFHLWSGARHEGGRRITVEAPVGAPPVFHRDQDRPELRAIP